MPDDPAGVGEEAAKKTIMNFKDLAIDHPYYCSTTNFYDNQCSGEHTTWLEFWEEYADADPDMNLLFRWDMDEYKESPGNYSLTLFYIGQRKGQFWSVHIKRVFDADMPAIAEYLSSSWQYLQKVWEPISNLQSVNA
jgi:hypothetical protein